MDKKTQTLCFTGHRELGESKGFVEGRLKGIIQECIDNGYLYFGAGGARGFDTIAAQTVLEFKKKYPQIHLILVLPFENQYEYEGDWTNKEIKEYQKLKEEASKVVHLHKDYTKSCYYERNRHLVNNSSLVISYQYKNTGGTAYTVKYAERKEIPVINCFKESTITKIINSPSVKFIDSIIKEYKYWKRY